MGKEATPRVFDFPDYKEFLLAIAESHGRGFWQELAAHLRVHSSLVSQFVRGDKNPTEEQACLIAEKLDLDMEETEYLLMLILRERAGNLPFRRFVESKLSVLQLQANKPSSRVKATGELNESDKSEFYSHWYYSAIRLLTSIEGYQTPSAIAETLGLPLERVNSVLEFLVSRDLCRKEAERFVLGTPRTHESHASPHTLRHHVNWRLKALERLPHLPPDRFAFTCPFTASKADEARFRRSLSDFISEFNQIVDQSPSQKLYCLNIDWFDVEER